MRLPESFSLNDFQQLIQRLSSVAYVYRSFSGADGAGPDRGESEAPSPNPGMN